METSPNTNRSALSGACVVAFAVTALCGRSTAMADSAMVQGIASTEWSQWLLPLGAVLIFIVLARRGMLSAAVLEAGPRRHLPFSVNNLVPIATFWLFGQAVAVCLRMVLPPEAMPMLVSQIAAYFTVTAYVVGVFLTRGSGRPIFTRITSRLALLRDGVAQMGLIPNNPRQCFREGMLGALVAVPTVWGINRAALILTSNDGTLEAGAPFAVSGSVMPIGLLVCVLLLAPLFEEFVFRGLVQSCFRNIGPRWFCIAAAAAIFAAAHIPVAAWQVLPGLLALGLILGWLYEHTGSLWPGIFAHAGFNFANAALFLTAARFAPVS